MPESVAGSIGSSAGGTATIDGNQGPGIGALPVCLAGPDGKLERVPAGAAPELDGIWSSELVGH